MTHPPNEDHSSIEHRARREASRRIAETPPERHRNISRVRRDAFLFLALLITGLILVLFADVPSTTYPEGRAIADRLDDAYRDVWQDGVTVVEAARRHDLHLEEYVVGDRTISVLTVPEPASHGFCYGLRLGGGGPTEAVRFRPTEGCIPRGRTAFDRTGTWTDVLGTERVTAVWFVPVVVLVVGAMVAVATDGVIAFMSKEP